MAELRRSLAFSALQSYFSVALQLASTVVLSRVLTPAEVGVYAVAVVFSALATNFRDFGVAEYLIQVRDPTVRQIRAAFGVNVMMSWAMALLMFVGATFVGEFYRSDVMVSVMHVQAMNFVLIPFGAINLAWFRRELNLKPQFVASTLSDTISLCVAIGLALEGHGPMSLAWSSLAGVAVTVAVSMYYRPRGFPRLPGLAGGREVLRFGSFASGIYLLGQLGRGAPEMVIGRVQGVADVAIFSRAGGLVQLFRQLVVRAVMPVCLPYFAKAVREEQSVNRAYVRGIAVFSAIGWTFLGYLAVAAFPVVRIIYGEQWAASVPLARILCVAGAVELVHYLSKEALLAHGQVKFAARLQVVLQVVQVLGLTAVFPFGLAGVCWGLLASSVAGLAIAQWHLRVGTGLTIAQLWEGCRTSLPVAVLALAPTALFFVLVPATETNYLAHLVITGITTAGCWLVALYYAGHPLWDEIARAVAPAIGRLAVLRGRAPRR